MGADCSKIGADDAPETQSTKLPSAMRSASLSASTAISNCTTVTPQQRGVTTGHSQPLHHDAAAAALSALRPPPSSTSVSSLSLHLSHSTSRNPMQPMVVELAEFDAFVSRAVPRSRPCTVEVPSSDSSRTRHDICAMSPLSLDRLEDWCASNDLFETAAGIQMTMPCASTSFPRRAVSMNR
ncbi:Hypothetical protein, putative [Bodo saltans]|uniref:Uncharacterized protein n=1 Tax=Bodo saltans TaxID=75058 RepID=A0A0S4IQA0_BODSA|nr:Hypothetical protein, putative [Bodo saltans]|eukprot:CUF94125.1 Hypothetical protein, putative [Bodo saltans]